MSNENIPELFKEYISKCSEEFLKNINLARHPITPTIEQIYFFKYIDSPNSVQYITAEDPETKSATISANSPEEAESKFKRYYPNARIFSGPEHRGSAESDIDYNRLVWDYKITINPTEIKSIICNITI